MPFLRSPAGRWEQLILAPFLDVQQLWHRYRAAEWSLQDISFGLESGELLGLLGPSGCGKTTLLRLIAGFERPSHGSISIEGRTVVSSNRWLAPERRGVGMLFQDYALFPHLSAWQNACFGLKPNESTSRVGWLMELLGLEGLAERFPHELSGGQRQRLALVRALAPNPRVLLLDEPFSNLDVDVRLRLRAELPRVLRECGVTAVMVTHDPEEALAICDQVAVISAGLWHQCAAPRQLVAQPATSFVARFVLQANVVMPEDLMPLLAAKQLEAFARLAVPASHAVLLRQEDCRLQANAAGHARVIGREFLGYEWLYLIELGEQRLRLRVALSQDIAPGERCDLSLREGWQPQLIQRQAAAPAAASPLVPTP